MADSVSVATTLNGLTSAFAQAPAKIRRIEPRRVLCLDGIEREIGLEGREFEWEILTTQNWHDLAAVCTGVAGYVRTADWIDPSAPGAADEWGDYSCILQIPTGAESRNGAYRYNIRLRVTRMVRVQDAT
jgi:hypothetical protein